MRPWLDDSPWINEKTELLVRLLEERYGLAITEDVARQDISNHVDQVPGPAARFARLSLEGLRPQCSSAAVGEMWRR
jgi:hypothetical protein